MSASCYGSPRADQVDVPNLTEPLEDRKTRSKVLKMLVLGEHQVGKTLVVENILSKKHKGPLQRYFPTPAPDWRKKEWTIEEETYTLQVWDIPPAPQSEALIDGFFRGTDMVVLVYNICKRETFEALETYLKRYRLRIPEDKATWLLVGTHRDRKLITPEEQQVSEAEAADFAEGLCAPSLRISLIDEYNFEWHSQIQDAIAEVFCKQFEIRIPR